jgi:HPt (histidine-containing phosphotransfer) domain-containing protein
MLAMSMDVLAPAPLYSSLVAVDPDFNEIVELFVAEIPERIASLKSHFVDRDGTALARAAHQLKGAAGSHGFNAVTLPAARLEAAAASGEPEDLVREALEDLIAICGQLRSGLPQ